MGFSPPSRGGIQPLRPGTGWPWTTVAHWVGAGSMASRRARPSGRPVAGIGGMRFVVLRGRDCRDAGVAAAALDRGVFDAVAGVDHVVAAVADEGVLAGLAEHRVGLRRCRSGCRGRRSPPCPRRSARGGRGGSRGPRRSRRRAAGKLTMRTPGWVPTSEKEASSRPGPPTSAPPAQPPPAASRSPSGAAVEEGRAGLAADQAVGARAAVEAIGAGAGLEEVVLGAAADHVVALAAVDPDAADGDQRALRLRSGRCRGRGRPSASGRGRRARIRPASARSSARRRSGGRSRGRRRGGPRR